MPRVGFIISARMGSKRFPGKVLEKIEGYSLAEILIRRLKKSRTTKTIILATTEKKEDDQLVELAQKCEIPFFRGDENDVLNRIFKAAQTFNIETVVRITGDCPLLDPQVVDHCVKVFHETKYEYVTTKYNYPQGIDCEVFSIHTLQKIFEKAKDPIEREHVTLHLWNHQDQYCGLSILAPPPLQYPEYVLTVDEPEDMERIQKIVSHFIRQGLHFNAASIIEFLHHNKNLIKLRKINTNFHHLSFL